MKKGRLLITLLSSTLLLAACGNNNQSGGQEPEPQPGPSVTDTISLDKTTASLKVGEELTLTATTSVENPTINWSTSNAQVATVAGGKVTAVGEGSAVITAKVAGKKLSATCEVTVTKDSSTPSGEYLITEPVEIQVKTTFNDTYGQILIDAAAELKAIEPNITVVYEKYSGSYDALKEEIVKGVPAGNYPDIAVAYPDSVADFIEAGVNLDMEPFMTNEEYGWTEEEMEDFVPAYLEEGSNYSVEGTFSLPIAKSTEAMYYDGDKMEGLVLDGVNGGNALTEEYFDNLTWEEVFDVLCPALMKHYESLDDEHKKTFLDTSNANYTLFGYDSDDNLFITLAEQYGYGYTSIDPVTGKGKIDFVNDGMKSLMKKFNDAHSKHYFSTKGCNDNQNINYLTNADQALFAIGSTGGVNYQFSAQNPKNVKVVHIPHAANGKRSVITQGPSIAFLDHHDENRALATWLYYKQLTTVDNCLIWATETGYAPVRQSVTEEAGYLDYCNAETKEDKSAAKLKALNAGYVGLVSTQNILFSSPVFTGSSEARKQVGGLLTKAVGAQTLTDEELNTLFSEAYNNTVLKVK